MNKKRGRPSLGKVVYKRRVLPAFVSLLDGVLSGRGAVLLDAPFKPNLSPPDPLWAQDGSKELEEARIQIKQLLTGLGEADLKIKDLETRRENYLRASESQKVNYWVKEYDKLKEKYLKDISMSQ